MKYNKIDKFENIWEILEFATAKYRNNIILQDSQTNKISYIDFLNRIKVFANYLVSQGVKENDIIVIFLDNKIEWFLIYFASILINSIVIPLDSSFSLIDVDKIAKKHNAKMIFTSKNLVPSTQLKVNYIEQFPEQLKGVKNITTRDYIKKHSPDRIIEIIYSKKNETTSNPLYISNKSLLTNLINTFLVFPITDDMNLLQGYSLTETFAQIITLGFIMHGRRVEILQNNSEKLLDNIKLSNLNYLSLDLKTSSMLVKQTQKHLNQKKYFVFKFYVWIIKKFPFLMFFKIFFFPIKRSLFGTKITHLISIIDLPHISKISIFQLLGFNTLQFLFQRKTNILTIRSSNSQHLGTPLPYQQIKVEKNIIFAKGEHIPLQSDRIKSKNNKWINKAIPAIMKKGKLFFIQKTECEGSA